MPCCCCHLYPTLLHLSPPLLLPGDVADTAAAVSTTFQLLSARFWRVVWVPGNHELWLRPDTRDRDTYPDSWAKLMALRQVCVGKYDLKHASKHQARGDTHSRGMCVLPVCVKKG